MEEARLSRRGHANTEVAKGFGRMMQIMAKPYALVENPDGYINLGISENSLAMEEITDYINAHQHITEAACAYGQSISGSLRLRKATAELVNDYFHPHPDMKIAAEDIHYATGLTAILDMIGTNLADPGDGILINRSVYGTFTNDFRAKAGLDIIWVPMEETDPFEEKIVAKYEKSLVEARSRGVNIRILLISNPHNPLGRCYPPATLRALANLCAKYDLHLISDEIYALSIFPTPESSHGASPPIPFSSVLSLDPSSHSLHRSRMHTLYAFSKDFAGSGLRMGCLITKSRPLLDAMMAIGTFNWVSSLADAAVANIFEDKAWVRGFIERSRKALAENYAYCTKRLDDGGIAYHRGGNAGFFLWIDFRPFMPKGAAEKREFGDGMEEGWEGERSLMNQFYEKRVWLNAGMTFQSERPGWFRIIFSQKKDLLEKGMDRILEVCSEAKAGQKELAHR